MKKDEWGEDEWGEDEWGEDGLWEVMGSAAGKRASGHFVDDTVRAARLSMAGEVRWKRLRWLLPIPAMAACVFAAVSVLRMGMPGGEAGKAVGVEVAGEAEQMLDEGWGKLEEAADAELLAAAVDHPEEFSDGELAMLMGF